MENRQGYFNGRSLFIGFCLSSIFRTTNTNFWLSEIIGMILGVLTILLVRRTNNYKFAKKFVGFVFTLLSVLLLVYMSSTLYLDETPNIILAGFALLGVFTISSCERSSLKRTFTFLFCFSLVMLLASQSLLIIEAKSYNLLPFFNTSISDTLMGAGIFYLASLTPILALNEVKVKEDKKGLLVNYCMASLSIILTSVMTVLVLGMNEAAIYRYPEYVVLKRIKVYEFFSNVDNAFTMIMVIDLLVTAATGLKNMELKGNISKVITFLILLFSVTYLSLNAGIMAMVYNFVPIILIILLILTLLPKKLQNKKCES